MKLIKTTVEYLWDNSPFGYTPLPLMEEGVSNFTKWEPRRYIGFWYEVS